MIHIIEITDARVLDEAFRIRRIVFCDEQRVDPALEFDGEDPVCRQYLARCDGRPVGTARIRDYGPRTVKIQRVAVLAADRGRGIGTDLMKRTIADAQASGARKIVIHAQRHAEQFYAGLGFVMTGEEFEETGIPHIRMELV